MRLRDFIITAAAAFALTSPVAAAGQGMPASEDQPAVNETPPDRTAPAARTVSPDTPSTPACDPNADSCAAPPPSDSGMVANLHPTICDPTKDTCFPTSTSTSTAAPPN